MYIYMYIYIYIYIHVCIYQFVEHLCMGKLDGEACGLALLKERGEGVAISMEFCGSFGRYTCLY